MRACAMRMLGESPAADDASTAPLLVTPAAATTGGALLPAAGGESGSVYPDSNMVIILAALLCVLICALVFNSLLRCARHFGRSLAVQAAPATAAAAMVIEEASATAGLNKMELRKIPVVEYETKDGTPGTEYAIGNTLVLEFPPLCTAKEDFRCFPWFRVYL